MARPKPVRTATDVPGVRRVVRKYEDGRIVTKYEARIRDALGKLRNVGTYDTKDAARRAINEARTDAQDGKFVPRSAGAVTFLSVGEGWLRSLENTTLKPSTLYGYRRILHNYCAPFHLVPVNRLGFQQVTDLMADVRAGRAPSTAGHVLHVLRQVFAHAVSAGYIRSNPALEVRKPKGGRQRVEIVLSTADVDRAIAALPDARGERPDRWRLLVETAADTGCRAGELAGLRVRNLDTTRRTVQVEETAQEVNGEMVFGPPKSEAGLRMVDILDPDLCRRLAAHVASMGPDDFVFGDGATPYRHNGWNNRVWRPTVDALGLEGVRFHDLRHYSVSVYLKLTRDALRTAKRAGHSKPSMTLDVYGHVLEDAAEDLTAVYAEYRAAARERAATAEAAPEQRAAASTAGGVVDLAAERRKRRVG